MPTQVSHSCPHLLQYFRDFDATVHSWYTRWIFPHRITKALSGWSSISSKHGNTTLLFSLQSRQSLFRWMTNGTFILLRREKQRHFMAKATCYTMDVSLSINVTLLIFHRFLREWKLNRPINVTIRWLMNSRTSPCLGPKVSVNQFLDRLPKSVVKNGQVIDIRQNLEQHIAVSERRQGRSVIQRIVDLRDTKRISLLQGKSDSTGRCERYPILLASHMSSHLLLLAARQVNSNPRRMRIIPSARFAFVLTTDNKPTWSKWKRRALSRTSNKPLQRRSKGRWLLESRVVKKDTFHFRQLPFDFDLFAMGTKLYFTDEQQTLEQCGLVPNATLGIREIKSQLPKK